MKKNLRKVMAMMAAAVMVMGVAGCSSSSTTTTDTASDDSADKTVIGIVQMADNGAFTDMREGFIAEMNAKGYDDSNTEFVYKNAQRDEEQEERDTDDDVAVEYDCIELHHITSLSVFP